MLQLNLHRVHLIFVATESAVMNMYAPLFQDVSQYNPDQIFSYSLHITRSNKENHQNEKKQQEEIKRFVFKFLKFF